MNLEEQKLWMEQWQAAASALQQQKAKDLRTLSDSEAGQAIESLLSLAGQIYTDPKRWQTSGLVEQQRLFRKKITT